MLLWKHGVCTLDGGETRVAGPRSGTVATAPSASSRQALLERGQGTSRCVQGFKGRVGVAHGAP